MRSQVRRWIFKVRAPVDGGWPDLVPHHESDERYRPLNLAPTPDEGARRLFFSSIPYPAASRADGRVFGFALIPPRGAALDRIDGFRAAFERVALYRQEPSRRGHCCAPPLADPSGRD